ARNAVQALGPGQARQHQQGHAAILHHGDLSSSNKSGAEQCDSVAPAQRYRARCASVSACATYHPPADATPSFASPSTANHDLGRFFVALFPLTGVHFSLSVLICCARRRPLMDATPAPAAPAQPPRLLDQLRLAGQSFGLSPSQVERFANWVKELIFFHGIRHPRELPP